MLHPTRPRDVIVADNDSMIRGILRTVLEGVGFFVLQMGDGAEAVNKAARIRAQLVLLDYRMPKLDGVAACAEIRRLPDYADVPIIMLTAYDDAVARATAEAAGVTAFLTKPFRPVDLLRAIARLPSMAPWGGGAHVIPPPAPEYHWKRQQEPKPLYGESPELLQGRRALDLCRR
ncbi:MAG: response regulator [Acetobacteraceae bacterium]